MLKEFFHDKNSNKKSILPIKNKEFCPLETEVSSCISTANNINNTSFCYSNSRPKHLRTIKKLK